MHLSPLCVLLTMTESAGNNCRWIPVSTAHHLHFKQPTFNEDFLVLGIIELDSLELEVGIDLLENEGFGSGGHGWRQESGWQE